MSKAKAKGTAAETAVVKWLRHTLNNPTIERRALQGNRDTGDIAGLPGIVIEVKNHARHDLPGWQSELQTEVDNASAQLGLLVIKKRGTTNPGDWYWLIDPRHIPNILKDHT
jgi:hypothetical protein